MMDIKEAIKALKNDCMLGIWSDDSIEAIQCFTRLEKELKQTKLNFRNSQIHSKNCYKKLKEKYTRLERAYKNNEVMTRDLNELINRNLELKEEIKKLIVNLNVAQGIAKKQKDENEKLKQALQEFVDKETPMKPFQTEYIDTHENVYVGICPKCKNENPQFKHQKYCWNCGQKLDWSDKCE